MSEIWKAGWASPESLFLSSPSLCRCWSLRFAPVCRHIPSPSFLCPKYLGLYLGSSVDQPDLTSAHNYSKAILLVRVICEEWVDWSLRGPIMSSIDASSPSSNKVSKAPLSQAFPQQVTSETSLLKYPGKWTKCSNIPEVKRCWLMLEPTRSSRKACRSGCGRTF